MTLGQYYRDKGREHQEAYLEFQKFGNFDIWPFMTENDCETELIKQPFLNGEPTKLAVI